MWRSRYGDFICNHYPSIIFERLFQVILPILTVLFTFLKKFQYIVFLFFVSYAFSNQTGNVTITSVTVVVTGSEAELGVKSYYAQGTYNLIGRNTDDDTAIYAQSQKDHDKKSVDASWSVIERVNKEWIGTVMIDLH